MQKANGLNLKMKGVSYSSLMSGMVLGFSCHPQTILNYEKTLAEANKREVQKQIKEATKVRSHVPTNNHSKCKHKSVQASTMIFTLYTT